MKTPVQLSIARSDKAMKSQVPTGKVFLVKAPYFTPWTPPLGIALLKSYLEQHGYSVTCFDFNTDADLWGMHHKYFTALQALEDVSINDGYSKLWWILNAHMLSYANGAGNEESEKVLETVIPMYGIVKDKNVIRTLVPLVERFYRRLEELIDRVDLSDYSMVGASTYTTSLGPSLFLLRKLKHKYPNTKTVMGGGIFADDLALGSDNLNTLIEECSYIDHVVLGEGELLLLKLIQGELSGKRVISLAELQGSTLDMKEVPVPDFSDFDPESYYHLTIEGARSCPFQCSFCSETIQWGDYRKKPADMFAEQVMELAQKYGNNSFFMGDSLMNPYIFQFSKALLEKDANVMYDGYLRADKPVTYRDKVKIWASSGLYRARLGIESASANVLNSMDKMTSPEIISNALKSLANAGIRTTTYWIVGFPGESEQDFQETLDFIREHHRYIYELEAHPYYYYPYGQIGSRLYECYSLYPDEVTNYTRFKIWEIIGANPTREERYDRLSRISSLAAELGLPNIYTMAERYAAEDRWHFLYPLAAEVYEGTRISRNEARPPEHPIKGLASELNADEDDLRASTDTILCYHTRVNFKVDETTLLDAISQLINYNEALQMSLQNGHYLPATEEAWRDQRILNVHRVGADYKIDELHREILARLLLEMAPEAGFSIRVALITSEKEYCDILLFAHRALADSQSVILLFEDLFRAYEQLSHKKEISLRPVWKTYAKFIEEMLAITGSRVGVTDRGESNFEGDHWPVVNAKQSLVTNLRFDKRLSERISSRAVEECLSPDDVMVIGLLRSLAKVKGRENYRIGLIKDPRRGDAGLEQTVGPLMQAYELPADVISGEAPQLDLKEMQRVLGRLSLSGFESRRTAFRGEADRKKRVILNLQYFVRGPWVGGDVWAPQGFLIVEGALHRQCACEITPILSTREIEIQVKHEEDPETSDLAREITERFAQEVEAILGYCEGYTSAKRFWQKEFRRPTPKTNIQIADGQVSQGSGYSSLPCHADAQVQEILIRDTGADLSAISLAAFAICLSRLNGQEDLVMLLSKDDGQQALEVPLRLYASWNLTFKDFVRNAAQKLALASKHGAYALDILTNQLGEFQQNYCETVFDVGYVLRTSRAGVLDVSSDAVPKPFSGLKQELKLVLNVTKDHDGAMIYLTCQKSFFRQETISSLASYLRAILENAAKDVRQQLGSIELGGDTRSDAVGSLARDAFNFDDAPR